jgi:hypothetical protein
VAEFLDVDPRTLHLPPSRSSGADPFKLMRQFSIHGLSTTGMPPPWVHRDGNGRLLLMDGVTRATRVAKYLPSHLIRVEVTGDYPTEDYSSYPTVEDTIP